MDEFKPFSVAMTAERWEQIQELFDLAADLPPSERDRLLAERCSGDTVLRRQVESLIASSTERDSWLSGRIRETIESAAHTKEPSEGDRAGAWQLVRPLGQGGMGSVWLAERADDQFAKRAAIKFVRAGLAAPELIERFRLERQVLASLEHPNIARLFDAGITPDGLPYLVMEYIEGKPIAEYCESGELGVRERIEIFRLICGAVQAAHGRLVVHRDLKPANILVTSDGVPKLLDFGIAKLLDATAEEGLTSHTQRLMTPEFASPEQVRGEPVTVATDVWGLGAVLFTILAGRPPFQSAGGGLHALERAICDEPPPAVSAVAAILVPADLDAIVAKGLRKEPLERYESAASMAADLGRYLDGYPVEARKGNWRYRARKFVQRHSVGLAAAGLVISAVSGGVISTVQAQRQAQRRFEQVRDVTNRFLFEVHGSIKSVPGTTAAQKLVVARGLEYLDGLASEGQNDPVLQGELASAYEKIADIQQSLRETSLNETAAALQSMEKAIAIRKRMVEAQPSNHDWLVSLITAEINASRRLQEHGKLDGAVAMLEQAIQRTAALEAGGRTSELVNLQIGAQMGLCRLGMYRSVGPATVAACKKEVDLNREFVQLEQGSAEAVYSLGVALVGYAESIRLVRNADPAVMDVLREAEKVNAKAQALAQKNIRYMIEGALIQSRMGQYYTGTGDLNQAARFFKESLRQYEAMAKADPNNGQVVRSASIQAGNLADVLVTLGRGSEAAEILKPSIALREARAAKDGKSYEALDDLTTGLYYLGKALTAEDPAGAEAALLRAVALRETLVKEHPDRVENQFRLARFYVAFADLRERQRQLPAAASLNQKAEAILATLDKRGQLNPLRQKLLANVRATVTKLRAKR